MHNDPQPPTADLFVRYLAGECTDDERTHVAKFLTTHPAHATLGEALRTLNESPEISDHSVDVAAGFARFQARIRQSVASHSRWTQPRNPISRGRIGATMFMSLAALLIGFFVTRHAPSTAPAGVGQIYETKSAQRAAVTLRDGSRVVLAPRSRLVVRDGFGTSTRTIDLVGEAQFTVTTAIGIPFTIQTGDVSTRVLGTAFSVRRYGARDIAQIAVTKGKVVASNPQKSVTVVAGQAALVDDSTIVTESTDHAQAYTDWATGRLVFRDARVSSMLESVGRWYGYRFVLVDSSLAKENVSVVLRLSDRADMVTALQEVLRVNMVFRDSVVTLRPRSVHDIRRIREGVRERTRERIRDAQLRDGQEHTITTREIGK